MFRTQIYRILLHNIHLNNSKNMDNFIILNHTDSLTTTFHGLIYRLLLLNKFYTVSTCRHNYLSEYALCIFINGFVLLILDCYPGEEKCVHTSDECKDQLCGRKSFLKITDYLQKFCSTT